MGGRLAYLRVFGWFLGETKGVRGKGTMLWLKTRRRVAGSDSASEPVSIPMKALGDQPLWVRPATTDLLMAVLDYRLGVHLPPPEIRDEELEQILELGANAGGALAGLAARYPKARILAIEPDPATAAVARRNAASYGDRCTVVTAAVWDSATTLTVGGTGATGHTVRPLRDSDGPEMPRIEARTVDDLLGEYMPEGDIDFLLITIEGTEERILRAGGDWAQRVRSVRAEFQPQLGHTPRMMSDWLEGLGFRTYAAPPGSLEDSPTQATPPERRWVYGVRPRNP